MVVFSILSKTIKVKLRQWRVEKKLYEGEPSNGEQGNHKEEVGDEKSYR